MGTDYSQPVLTQGCMYLPYEVTANASYFLVYFMKKRFWVNHYIRVVHYTIRTLLPPSFFSVNIPRHPKGLKPTFLRLNPSDHHTLNSNVLVKLSTTVINSLGKELGQVWINYWSQYLNTRSPWASGFTGSSTTSLTMHVGIHVTDVQFSVTVNSVRAFSHVLRIKPGILEGLLKAIQLHKVGMNI